MQQSMFLVLHDVQGYALICLRPEQLNLLVGALFGGDWRMSPMGRLNSLTWWVASSEKNTAKAFRTDIYDSALLHEV